MPSRWQWSRSVAGWNVQTGPTRLPRTGMMMLSWRSGWRHHLGPVRHRAPRRVAPCAPDRGPLGVAAPPDQERRGLLRQPRRREPGPGDLRADDGELEVLVRLRMAEPDWTAPGTCRWA